MRQHMATYWMSLERRKIEKKLKFAGRASSQESESWARQAWDMADKTIYLKKRSFRLTRVPSKIKWRENLWQKIFIAKFFDIIFS